MRGRWGWVGGWAVCRLVAGGQWRAGGGWRGAVAKGGWAADARRGGGGRCEGWERAGAGTGKGLAQARAGRRRQGVSDSLTCSSTLSRTSGAVGCG